MVKKNHKKKKAQMGLIYIQKNERLRCVLRDLFTQMCYAIYQYINTVIITNSDRSVSLD
jgi:hypothetical protein